MSAGFGVDQAAAVDFNSQARCQVVGDQELIGWILERINRPVFLQGLAIQDYLRFPETGINPKTLIRMDTDTGAGKIEDEIAVRAKCLPYGAGIEYRFANPGSQFVRPTEINSDVRLSGFTSKLFQRATQANFFGGRSTQRQADSADTHESPTPRPERSISNAVTRLSEHGFPLLLPEARIHGPGRRRQFGNLIPPALPRSCSYNSPAPPLPGGG